MQSEGFVFEEKPVFDWNHVPVGTVRSALRSPKTGAAQQLVLTLTPQARDELGLDTMELPASLVCGMRKDGLTLDRSLSELRRTEAMPSRMKK